MGRIEYGELKRKAFRNGGEAQTVLDSRLLFPVFTGYTHLENNPLFLAVFFKMAGEGLGIILLLPDIVAP